MERQTDKVILVTRECLSCDHGLEEKDRVALKNSFSPITKMDESTGSIEIYNLPRILNYLCSLEITEVNRELIDAMIKSWKIIR